MKQIRIRFRSLFQVFSPYDKVNIFYKSRGEMLIIEADNKNVTMKTKALEEDRENIIKGHADGVLFQAVIISLNGKSR